MKKGTFLLVATLAIMVIMVIRGCVLEFRYARESANRKEISREPSPDGKLDLVVVRVQPTFIAAIAPSSDEVYVVRHGQSFDRGELVFRSWGDTYASHVDWVGSRSVHLTMTPGRIRFLTSDFSVSLGDSFVARGTVHWDVTRNGANSSSQGRLGVPYHELFSGEAVVAAAPVRWDGGCAFVLSVVALNGKGLSPTVDFWVNLQHYVATPTVGEHYMIIGVEQPMKAWPPFKQVKIGGEKLQIFDSTLGLESLTPTEPTKPPSERG